MKRVFQTKLGENGNCLEACVASLFDLELGEVLEFDKTSGRAQIESMAKFVKDNFSLETLQVMAKSVFYFPKVLCIASGKSPRLDGINHAVIWDLRDPWNLKLFHDPHPDGTGLPEGQSEYIFFIEEFRD